VINQVVIGETHTRQAEPNMIGKKGQNGPNGPIVPTGRSSDKLDKSQF
jgi:hypothetical protein